MTLKSILKLRIFAQSEFLPGDTAYEVIHLYADEIEAEVTERYMERPCDKNGEPTYVGQRIKHRGHEGEVWLLGVHEVMCSDHVCYPCGEYEHVKQRTLEDVLQDFLVDYDDWDENVSEHRMEKRRKLFDKYAAEIRELLGVDA